MHALAGAIKPRRAVGASPSGKASVFGTDIPRFESWRPNHFTIRTLLYAPFDFAIWAGFPGICAHDRHAQLQKTHAIWWQHSAILDPLLWVICCACQFVKESDTARCFDTAPCLSGQKHGGRYILRRRALALSPLNPWLPALDRQLTLTNTCQISGLIGQVSGSAASSSEHFEHARLRLAWSDLPSRWRSTKHQCLQSIARVCQTARSLVNSLEQLYSDGRWIPSTARCSLQRTGSGFCSVLRTVRVAGWVPSRMER